VKGDLVAFALVRDDGEPVTGPAGVFRDGDRFKVLLTCSPGTKVSFDFVVYEAGHASFPLAPARGLACGNGVPVPGAFRVTGSASQTVCVVWTEGDSGPDRVALGAASAAPAKHSLCKTLTPAEAAGPR
jgi:hypothetical protein